MRGGFVSKARANKAFKVSFLLIIVLLPSYYITTVQVPVDRPIGGDSQNPSSEVSSNGEPSQQSVSEISSPASQTHRILLILARLKDQTNLTSVAEMTSLVFTEMKSYFEEVSYGIMSIEGNATGWIDINNNTVDYGRDTGSGSAGVDDTDGDGVPDSWKLIRDAMSLIDGSVNFTYYDDIILVHSGTDQAKTHNSNNIWSSEYTGLEIATNDGTTIEHAVIIAETDPVGIFAHEFGHELGLPDLYNAGGGSEYVGVWDLMALGAWLPGGQGTSPSQLTSWCKSKLGWISENSTAIGRSMEEVIDPLEIQGSHKAALKIPITTETYYMAEVRSKTGYDTYLPSAGVLILYIDESRSSGEGIVTVKYSQNLYQATYTNETGKDVFIDNGNNINLTVVAAQSPSSYQVKVSLIRADSTPPSVTVTNPVGWGWPATRAANVSAVITDTGLSSSSVKNASILYSSDGRRTWNRVQMIPGHNNIYSGVIPPQNSSKVEYYVEAYDFAGNVAVAKSGNQPFAYGSVAQIVLVVAFTFVVVILALISTMYLRTQSKGKRKSKGQPQETLSFCAKD